MIQILSYVQIAVSILLIAGILLQRSEASLGAAFGGDSAVGGRFTRRGFEKTLFQATLVLAILFAILSFATFLLGR